MEIPVILIFITTWLGVTWAIYRVFKEADEIVNSKTKKAVSRWLKKISKKKEFPNWPKYFINLFDKFYTRKHWSIKCFLRSILSSTIVFLIFGLIHTIQFRSYKIIYHAADRIVSVRDDHKLVKNNEYKFNMALYLAGNSLKATKNYPDIIQYDDQWIDSIRSKNYFRDTISFLGDLATLTNSGVQLIEDDRKYFFSLDEIKDLRNTYLFWKLQIERDPSQKESVFRTAVEKYAETAGIIDKQETEGDLFKFLVDYYNYPFLILYLIIFNFIIDYFSLLETRWVLGLMSNATNVFGRFLYLILDILLTLFIFFVIWNIFFYTFSIFDSTSSSIIKNGYSFLNEFSSKNFLQFLDIGNRSSVVFYTTFFTSIWLWLFSTSGLLIRTASSFNKGFFLISKWFNINEKPFGSMGFFSMLIVSIVFLIWGVYLWAK